MKKKTYTIRFYAKAYTDIKVKAESLEDAYELADEKYCDGDYNDSDTYFENEYCECINEEN